MVKPRQGVFLALLAGLGSVFASPSSAQIVQGQVIEGANNRPVAGGTVVLLDEAGRPVVRTYLTADAMFSIAAPGPGRYAVRFETPGYLTVHSDWLDLRPGTTLVVTLRGTPITAADLDTVFVRGERVPFRMAPFYERRARGAGGEFFTPEDVERRDAHTPTEILRYSMGFNVVPNYATYRSTMTQKYLIVNRRLSALEQQTCPPLIFVDGLYVGNAYEVEVDAFFDGAWLGAVEAYPGTASVPPEYNREGAKCGVIGLWSNSTQPAGAGVSRALYLGVQAGASVSGPFGGEYVGAHTIITLSRVADVVIAGGGAFDAAGGWTKEGWQAWVALRVRPLGRRTPWYVGGGGGVLEREHLALVTPGGQTGREYLVLVTGVTARLGRVHPFVQIDALDPFPVRNADLQIGVGASYQVY